MIDTHCHIDLYPDPIKIAKESERLGIVTIGMTNLPSHFEMGYPHLAGFRKVRLALGMHPLHAEAHIDEFNKFKKNIDKTSYIGEIGLDFSREGYATKELQLETFRKILLALTGKKKLLSLHSRRAEKVVLDELVKNKIASAIFHWYSGPPGLIEEIAGHGYYFSVNPAMILSDNGKKIIARIPKGRMLTETDGPFIESFGSPVKPVDVRLVHQYLSDLWVSPLSAVVEQIHHNFNQLISLIK
jgi:TatD DNase family protein